MSGAGWGTLGWLGFSGVAAWFGPLWQDRHAAEAPHCAVSRNVTVTWDATMFSGMQMKQTLLACSVHWCLTDPPTRHACHCSSRPGARGLRKAEHEHGLLTLCQLEFCLFARSFKYPGREDFGMRNMNIGIDMGSRVAIVGPNGAGEDPSVTIAFSHACKCVLR